MINLLKEKITVISLIIFFLIFLIIIYSFKELINIELIIQKNDLINNLIDKYFLLSALIAFIFIVLCISFLIPLTPLVLITGYYFGTYNSIYICITAEFFGSLIVYIYSRYFFYNLLNNKFYEKISRYRDKFNQNSFYYLIFLRIVGGIPFTLQCILCGIFKMPLKAYSVATIIGIIPYIYIYSSIGDKFNNVIELKSFKFIDILSYEYLIPVILLLAIIFIPKFFYDKKIN